MGLPSTTYRPLPSGKRPQGAGPWGVIGLRSRKASLGVSCSARQRGRNRELRELRQAFQSDRLEEELVGGGAIELHYPYTVAVQREQDVQQHRARRAGDFRV